MKTIIILRKKFLSMLLALCVTLSMLLVLSSSYKVKADYSNPIISDQYYYLKNLRTGKYMTTYNNSSNIGTQIVQWQFNGGNNQKWKLSFNSSGVYGGFYRIVSYMDNSKVVYMANASGNDGVNAQIGSYDNNVNQMFGLTYLSNGAFRLYTNASNCIKVLGVQNGSVNNNASVVQLSTSSNWYDQWIIEPEDGYSSTFSKLYAVQNNEHRLCTFPNFDKYTGSSSITSSGQYLYNNLSLIRKQYESINFVSQCLNAGGYHYDDTGSNYNKWYINKKDFMNVNTNFSDSILDSYWYITNSWYKGNDFYYKWTAESGKNFSQRTVNDILNNNSINLSYSYGIGDIVLITQYEPNAGISFVTFASIITSSSGGNSSNIGTLKNATISCHTTNNTVSSMTINQLCQSYSGDHNPIITFVKFN